MTGRPQALEALKDALRLVQIKPLALAALSDLSRAAAIASTAQRAESGGDPASHSKKSTEGDAASHSKKGTGGDAASPANTDKGERNGEAAPGSSAKGKPSAPSSVNARRSDEAERLSKKSLFMLEWLRSLEDAAWLSWFTESSLAAETLESLSKARKERPVNAQVAGVRLIEEL